MTPDLLKLAAEVHDGLLKLVAPASPGSIEASSLRPTRNPALFFIGVFGVASFLVFIFPIIFLAIGGQVFDLLQIIGAAGLGSSFYALHTASSYIKSGTFDPKYNNTYLIRLVLGLLSGLILAYFLKDLLHLNTAKAGGGTEDPGAKVALIGVSALALVGGYAAEAVAQILDRVSETLVALISGSDKDKIEAARQKAQADAEKKTTEVLGDTVKRLHDALNDPNPAAVASNVQKVMQEILARK
jgi:hypothetical protein